MNRKRYSLKELSGFLQAQIVGDDSGFIDRMATLQKATVHDLSFLANPAYAKYLPSTSAGAVILSPDQIENCPVPAIVVDNPYLAYARLSHLLDYPVKGDPGIDISAQVHDDAEIAESATLDAGVVVQAGVVIGENAYIGPNTIIGKDSIVGKDTILHAGVRVYHGVTIGDRCIVHSGAVLGADGFGFAPDPSSGVTCWHKIAQLGGVLIGDDVEIGANTCIDRGALDNTVIADGVKLDNQIQIAHNVRIGAHSVIAACVGIAGSTTVGEHCIFGGGCGISGHLTITDNVHLTGMSMVTKSISEPGVYSSGTGLESNRKWHKTIARMRRLDDMAKKIKAMEKKLGRDD
jgi:UDP-3-O-[3-hydroxymyristoyl] glucosamine N-acyltransferase